MKHGSPIFHDYYLLFEAFNLLAYHLFADEWSGWEITEPPPDAHPGLAKAAHDDYGREIAKLNTEINQWLQKKNIAVLDSEKEEVEATLQPLCEKRDRLQKEKDKIPLEKNDPSSPFQRWSRSVHTGHVFMQGLRDGAFKIHACGSRIEPREWEFASVEKRGYRLNFGLSIVHAPMHQGRDRHSAAFVPRDDFHVWLLHQAPLRRLEVHALAPLDACASFLRVTLSSASERISKKQLLTDFKALYGHIGDSDFTKVWEAVAPDDWKKGGRTRKPS